MVQIFTDTAANLPMKLLEEYGIRTVPLSYEVDGVEPDYSIEFNGPAFYEAMRRGASVKTSMVNPEQAARAIEESLQAGMDVHLRRHQRQLLGRGCAVQGAGGKVRLRPHRRVGYPGCLPGRGAGGH